VRKAVLLGAMLVALGVGASTANAATVRWPAHCSNFKCVNKHLNQLHAQFLALKAWKQSTKVQHAVSIGSYLFTCGVEFPESLDLSTGDFFPTPTGNTPDVWALGDGCNTSPAVQPRASGHHVRLAPLAAMLR
jgi:hypothetical protein